MKTMRCLAALAAFFIILPHAAYSQGVTRICIETVNPLTGANNCVQISTANPVPIISGANGGLVQRPAPVASALAGGDQYGLSVNSVTSLTVPAGAIYAYVCAETAAVRWTADGTTPTSTVGQLIIVTNNPNPCISFNVSPLTALKFLGAGATIDVTYFKAVP